MYTLIQIHMNVYTYIHIYKHKQTPNDDLASNIAGLPSASAPVDGVYSRRNGKGRDCRNSEVCIYINIIWFFFLAKTSHVHRIISGVCVYIWSDTVWAFSLQCVAVRCSFSTSLQHILALWLFCPSCVAVRCSISTSLQHTPASWVCCPSSDTECENLTLIYVVDGLCENVTLIYVVAGLCDSFFQIVVLLSVVWYGAASISRLLKIIGLFCKRAL